MGDLTLSNGSLVTMCGAVERTNASREAIVWVRDPWEPEREQRFAGGGVPVYIREGWLPSNGVVVRVRGIWTGTSITEASAEPTWPPTIYCAQGPTDRLTPGEVDMETFVSIDRAIDAASSSLISSGCTDDAIWSYVLHMTRQLERVQRDSPVRVDFFTAITPCPPLSGARAG